MDIKIISPDLCKHCGWKPTTKNNENQKISIEKLWLTIPIPNSVVWLYVCPECNCVMANENAVENVKKLNEAKDQRIIMRKSQKGVDFPGVRKNLTRH